MCNQNETNFQYYYLDYLHREVGLTQEDVNSIPWSGQADDACSQIADKEYVIKQFEKYSTEKLMEIASKLADSAELKTRKDAIMYIVWVAGYSIKEEQSDEKEDVTIILPFPLRSDLCAQSAESPAEHTVELINNKVLIDGEYAGSYESALSGWFVAHYLLAWENCYRFSKADTLDGLKCLISETANKASL